MKVMIATGSEELNDAVIEYDKQHDYEQAHYREYLLENDKYGICIISSILPGEMELEQLVYELKRNNKRIIFILVDENDEELNIIVKYQITDILKQPVTPKDIVEKINCPGEFKDIEYIYQKLGTDIEVKPNKVIKKDKSSKRTINLPTINIVKNEKETVNNIILCEKIIAITKLSNCAGATFITLNLAQEISKYVKVVIIENPANQSIYNTIDIHNKMDNIIYAVTNPNQDKENNEENTVLKLFQSTKAPIKIYDVGSVENIDNNIIDMLDTIIVVIDPYLPMLINSVDKLKEIKKYEHDNINVVYVVNKFNDGVDSDELINCLGIKPYFVPMLDAEHVYKAAYENKSLYEYKSVRQKLEKSIQKVAELILPNEIKKNKKLFRRTK